AVPSQLLSRPSQISALGGLEFWQTHAPLVQTSVPWAQGAVSVPLPVQVAPTGGHQLRVSCVQQLPGRAQQPVIPAAGASASGPSSMAPSQSLSSPSHCSGMGPTLPEQTRVPLTHAMVPVEHSPVLMPHDVPTCGTPSSTMPSQSLSLPSHTSGLG